MFCKKCGKEIADDSEFCQFCGEKQNNETQSYDEAMKKYENKENDGTKMPTGCFVTIAVFLVFLFIIILVGNKPIEEDELSQEILAKTLCQQETLKYLRNPKIADFASSSETVLERIENMRYNIYSHVYSTNIFGGTQKFNYACSVKLIDENSGTITKFNIDK